MRSQETPSELRLTALMQIEASADAETDSKPALTAGQAAPGDSTAASEETPGDTPQGAEDAN